MTYIIKDEMGKEIFRTTIETIDIPRIYARDLLFNMSFSTNIDGLLKNLVFFKGTATDKEIDLISPSVPEITKDFNCVLHDIEWNCLECAKNYKVLDGRCVEDHFSNGIKFLHHFEVFNNNYKEQKLDISDTSNFTLNLFINKLAYSLWDESSTSHRLISLVTKNNEVITLLSEKVDKEYVSLFSVGGTEYKFDFTKTLPNFFNIVISNKKDNCKIIVKFNDLEVDGEAACKDLDSIIFGDLLGHEMHWEFKEGYIYPNSFEKTAKELLKKTIKNSNPICNLTDYSTGDCLTCPSKFVLDKNNHICNHMIAGFSQNYLFNYTSRNSVPNKTQFVYDMSNSMNQKKDVNSESYAVSGWIRILQDGSLNNKSANKFYELFSLRNNVHIEDYNVNPSSKLISFGYEIINGSSNYYIYISNIGENVKRTIKNVEVKIDSWTFVMISVNVVNKLVSYDVVNDENSDKSEIKLSSYPERLQSAGQLISYGIFEKAHSQFSLPSAESKNLYLVPNLSSYDKVKNHILNNLMPESIDDSMVLENCKATVIDANDEYVCISCEETYNMVKNEDGLIECVETNKVKQEENPEFTILNSGLLDNESACITANKQEYTAFYFRLNKLPSVNDYTTLVQGLNDAILLMNESNVFYLTNDSGSVKSSEISAFNLLNWNSIIINKGDSFDITYNGPGDTSSSINQHIVFGNAAELKICFLTSDVQIYGVHSFKNNYGVPLISEPQDMDCSYSCDKCTNGYCSSSTFGVDNGKTKAHFFSLSKLVRSASVSSIALNSVFRNTSKLRSERYTFKTILNIVGKTDSPNNQIVKILVSSNSFIKISMSNDLQNFIVTYRSILDSSAEKQNMITLPKKLTGANMQIYLSVGFKIIEGIVYEDLSNYKIFSLTLDNDFEPLNASSVFELISATTSGNEFISFSNVMLSIDNKLALNSLIEDANQNDNLYLQTTCLVRDNSKCLKCKENYTLSSEGQCSYGEISFINQSNNQIRLVSNDHKLSKTYQLTSAVSTLTYSINLNAPIQYSKKVGIARISSGKNTLIEIFTLGTSIIAKNNLNDKLLVLNDYFTTSSTSNFVNIAVFADFNNGYFKLNAYEPFTNRLETTDSTGKVKEELNLSEVKVEVGFEDDNQNTEMEYKFKISTSILSINSNDLVASYVIDTTVKMNICSSACLENCNENGICPSDKLLNSINLIKRDDDELLHSTEDLEPRLVNAGFLYDYLVVLELTKTDLMSRFNNQDLASNTATTLLTFTEALKECKGYKSTSFLPDEIQNKHSFSIVYSDQKLMLNPYEGETGERYLLLPIDIKLEEVESMRMEIRVSIEKNSFMFNIYIDNLLFKMAYHTKSKNLQPFSKDTCIFTSPALLTADIYFNNLDNMSMTTTRINSVKDQCKLNNCSNCLVNNSGEKLCTACNQGFAYDSLSGACLTSEITPLLNFTE